VHFSLNVEAMGVWFPVNSMGWVKHSHDKSDDCIVSLARIERLIIMGVFQLCCDNAVEDGEMTREEKHIVMRRFSQLHIQYLQLISSDPKNAKYYEIMIDHYRRQYCALGSKKHQEEPQNRNNIFI
jgi:hypothetical protein